MENYLNVIEIYLQKKTIKKYETLEEFHSDLSKFKYKFDYNAIHVYPVIFCKLNEVDFTFLICKLIDEGEYVFAYHITSANMRYNNQKIQTKFREHIKDYPKKFKTKIPTKTLINCIEHKLLIEYKEEDVQLHFTNMLTDSTLFKNSEICINQYFSDLGQIIDLDKIIYYNTNKYKNRSIDYHDILQNLSYSNQCKLVSILIKKGVVNNLEMFRLIALYRDIYNDEETKIYNQLFDKFLGITDLKQENKRLKEINKEFCKKYEEFKKQINIS